MNPFREGDYFLYIDKTKTAYFQVSERFGKALKDVLVSAGMTTMDLIRVEEEEAADYRRLIEYADKGNLLGNVARSPNPELDEYLQAAKKIGKVTLKAVKMGAKVGGGVATIAGAAMCNVM
jgi:hypothetical protein